MRPGESLRRRAKVCLWSGVLLVAGSALACGGGTTGTSTTSTSTTSSERSAEADEANEASAASDGGVGGKLEACLTTYVECQRAGADDASTCRADLRACLAPPRPPADCDGGAPMGPPPGGGRGAPPPRPTADDGGLPPPPPRDGHGAPPALDDGGLPPPPPGFGAGRDDGGLPPPPPDAKDGGVDGPRACLATVDVCAAGSDAVSTCVNAGVACFEALPPPPRR
jgi:hypothetical protein